MSATFEQSRTPGFAPGGLLWLLVRIILALV